MGCDTPGLSAFLMGLFTGTFSSITIKVSVEEDTKGGVSYALIKLLSLSF